jgi:hypothetical protein
MNHFLIGFAVACFVLGFLLRGSFITLSVILSFVGVFCLILAFFWREP